MTDKKLKKAINLLEKYKDFLKPRWGKPASNETISKTEELIGYELPQDFKEYLKKYGHLSFYDEVDVYGIVDDDIESKSNLNFVYKTIEHRRNNNMPKHLIPVYSFGFLADEHCLNYNELNAKGDPKIFICYPEDNKFGIKSAVNNSFSDLLLDLIESELIALPDGSVTNEKSEKEDRRKNLFSF